MPRELDGLNKVTGIKENLYYNFSKIPREDNNEHAIIQIIHKSLTHSCSRTSQCKPALSTANILRAVHAMIIKIMCNTENHADTGEDIQSMFTYQK